MLTSGVVPARQTLGKKPKENFTDAIDVTRTQDADKPEDTPDLSPCLEAMLFPRSDLHRENLITTAMANKSSGIKSFQKQSSFIESYLAFSVLPDETAARKEKNAAAKSTRLDLSARGHGVDETDGNRKQSKLSGLSKIKEVDGPSETFFAAKKFISCSEEFSLEEGLAESHKKRKSADWKGPLSSGSPSLFDVFIIPQSPEDELRSMLKDTTEFFKHLTADIVVGENISSVLQSNLKAFEKRIARSSASCEVESEPALYTTLVRLIGSCFGNHLISVPFQCQCT